MTLVSIFCSIFQGVSWIANQNSGLSHGNLRFLPPQSYRFPPINGRPYDRGLWKPIGFPTYLPGSKILPSVQVDVWCNSTCWAMVSRRHTVVSNVPTCFFLYIIYTVYIILYIYIDFIFIYIYIYKRSQIFPKESKNGILNFNHQLVI